jgi:hypothetical protein
MARTNKVFNSRAQVPYCTVVQTLNTTRPDADLDSIRPKVLSLLKQNKLKISGKLDEKLKRLIRFYGENPRSLPTWNDLSLYPIKEQVERPQVTEVESFMLMPLLLVEEENPPPIIFELDEDGELFEVVLS